MKIELPWSGAEKLIEDNTVDGGRCELHPAPLVSVSLVTYQHASYVEQAIRSILDQTTDFPFEVVVGDDSSTDGTFELLKKYQERHPTKIRLIQSRPNLGVHTGNGRLNLIRNLRACRGKYIALLEGDDYWIEKSKLQQQVDFLESNPDYSGCCGNSMIRWEYGKTRPMEIYNKVPLLDPLPLSEMVTRYVAQTGSYCMRGVPEWVYTDWFVNLDAADNALLWGMAMNGKVKYEKEAWTVWRRQQGTATSVVGSSFFRHFSHRSEILTKFEEIYGVCLLREKEIIFNSGVSSAIVRNPRMAIRRLLGSQYRRIRAIFYDA